MKKRKSKRAEMQDREIESKRQKEKEYKRMMRKYDA